MSRLRSVAVLALVGLFAAGCANTGLNRADSLCMLSGAAVGAVAGGLIAGDGEEAGGATIGAVTGATLAGVLCAGKDSDGDGVADKKDRCPGTPAGVAVDDDGCPPDTDGDGVADYRDDCPRTPAGAPVDDSGCPLDSDGDGVTDDKDQCPRTPRGVEVDGSGCPLDSDGDGVADYRDDCPDTPRGKEVNSKGCHLVLRLDGVNFAYDSAELTREAEVQLDLATEMLQSNDIRVRVEGHTDSRGSEAYNQELSQRRAQAVVDYLIEQGISPDRLNAVGYGENTPIRNNDTEAGRAKNRRVDFTVMD